MRSINSNVVITIDVDQGNDYFCNQFSFFIIFGQWFGLLPVRRFYKNGKFDVHFKWYSPRIIYSFLNILGNLVLGIFCIVEFSFYGFQLDRSGTLVFYVMNFIGSLAFVEISRNWSHILSQWTLTEIALKSYGPLQSLRKRLILTSIIIVLLATGE
ncbi:hypothetical protein HHI36_004945 [Cryptolaemus montrouzieri]|uniref:Uncharacterized protein n=1 Tax=Cryptolaemus montrouzieri TaxID=559131 RepID=A0ABD2NTL9_9CUCU